MELHNFIATDGTSVTSLATTAQMDKFLEAGYDIYAYDEFGRQVHVADPRYGYLIVPKPQFPTPIGD